MNAMSALLWLTANASPHGLHVNTMELLPASFDSIRAASLATRRNSNLMLRGGAFPKPRKTGTVSAPAVDCRGDAEKLANQHRCEEIVYSEPSRGLHVV